MAITCVSEAIALSSDAQTATTTGIDTTGANLIVVTVSFIYHGTPPSVSDSYGNSWTLVVESAGGGSLPGDALFYCADPTVGTGHTFACSTVDSGYPLITAQVFSGAAASPYDQQSGSYGGSRG